MVTLKKKRKRDIKITPIFQDKKFIYIQPKDSSSIRTEPSREGADVECCSASKCFVEVEGCRRRAGPRRSHLTRAGRDRVQLRDTGGAGPDEKGRLLTHTEHRGGDCTWTGEMWRYGFGWVLAASSVRSVRGRRTDDCCRVCADLIVPFKAPHSLIMKNS